MLNIQKIHSTKSACNAGDWGSIPGSGRCPGEGNGNPLQYSCPENFMDIRAWWAIVHGVAKSRTQLSNWHTLCQTLFLCSRAQKGRVFLKVGCIGKLCRVATCFCALLPLLQLCGIIHFLGLTFWLLPWLRLSFPSSLLCLLRAGFTGKTIAKCLSAR